ncbi:MAG: hypothetical protein OEY21_03390 [Nitrospira sp.]|nr:hypothetical protein [Nitrospira sp.]MDH4327658.1 hypothetical protein [Nitrospira sp.]MDH5625126.1 hypothetical protein [Nitrospira sp.]
MARDEVAAAWQQHCLVGWPQFSSPNEGQLMTLDTVISGCVVFFLDSPEGLDDQRMVLVKDCLSELDDLTAALDADSQAYFLRLRRLGEILLATAPQP